jgi:DNA invertase Pin-like site-specific DNA recombinase
MRRCVSLAEYVIAKYIRLSIEDAQNDSMSIENQRLILNTYIAGMDLPGVKVLEFTDNGYSGTNYERPGVQELIALVMQGGVNCIIVKDFSRFGRSMIDTAYYIERVFPLYRTRFISLSDNFDSAEHAGGMGGLDVTFQFLLHEQYSRDLSKKIRTAKQIRAQRGELISKNCAFGFKKAGNRLEIDEPAAETVRLIFDLAAQGQSNSKIAARLYEDKRPTPAEYKDRRTLVKAKDLSCVWNKSIIQDILADEQYIGTYVAGKTKNLDVGSGKQLAVPSSEWIRIPDHHPAIIDKAAFDAVRARIDKRGEPLRKRNLNASQRYKDISSPLRGKVVCGVCGHTMHLSPTQNPAFHCDFTRAAPDAKCHRLRIPGADLESTVFSQIREKALAILANVSDVPSDTTPKYVCETQAAQIEDKKCALYERYVLGEISAGEYKTAKNALDTELEREKRAQAALAKEMAAKTACAGLRQLAEGSLNNRELTKALADALIVKVCVFPDDRVEVIWKAAGFDATLKV